VLRVTDNDGETGRTNKSIYVSPAAPPGPAASFTASPTSGTSPLTVFVDASASTYDTGVISQYRWNWGDGSTGYGKTASHTYFSTGAKTYTLTLTLYATDGKTGTATRTISVTIAGATTPAAGAPSARFTIVDNDNVGVAPFKVAFNPADSEAAEGRVLASFVWSYGDGDSDFDVDAVIQVHTFTTRDPSEIFSVNLLVLDNASASNSITKTVKVYNHQPVAGFEVGDPEHGHTPGADDDDVHFGGTVPLPIDGDHWHTADITYGNLQVLGTFPQTVSVVIRSKKIDDVDWFDINGSLPQATLETSETLATSSTIPVPDGFADNEYSYDPEGQTWLDGIRPAWFTNRGWGIEYLYVDWGDGAGEEQFGYVDLADTLMYHNYQFSGTATSKTITVRAVDYLGAQDTFSRIVFFREGVESADESAP